jgi:hypothetical protein
VRRLIVTALFFEIGVVLLVVPWMPYWQQNYFIDARPFVEPLLTNGFVKGAISGLGLVNLVAGLFELASMFMANRTEPDEEFPATERSQRQLAPHADLPPREVSPRGVPPALSEDRH